MTVGQWYNSDVLQSVRSLISGDDPLAQCVGCYDEEASGYESRRIRENFKSAIFTEKSFERSYQQSPWFERFESTASPDLPRDWHVDFGNECNLACKMCNAQASSTIAAHLRKIGKHTGSVKTSWTDDTVAWENFLKSIDESPVHRIHVMGGEPVLIKKYHEFIDYLISKERFDISLSFVSNGTLINQSMIDKLKLFQTASIEISIESIYDNNDYIRQGSDISSLLRNLDLLIAKQDDRLQLILRTVPQALSIGTYIDLMRYAWDNRLIIEAIPLNRPRFMAIDVLPIDMRKKLLRGFQDLEAETKKEIKFDRLQTGRNIGTLADKIARECRTIIKMLEAPEPENVESLRTQLAQHLSMWDKIYGMDARTYYPELSTMLEEHGYAI
jgi:hypothetical protein